MERPDFLYRYTNVDSLRHIINDRTIRFSPLTVMDDLEEQFSFDDNQEGKCVFISCWTDKPEEDVKMWYDYCRPDLSCGVRIKLPVNPFSITENMLFSFEEVGRDALSKVIIAEERYLKGIFGYEPRDFFEAQEMIQRLKKEYPDEFLKLYDSVTRFSHEHVYCLTPDVNSILYKVNYTNNYDLVFPRIHTKYETKNENYYLIDFDKFGKYKNTDWAWQSEWRYRLHFRSLRNGRIHDDGTIDIYDLPFDHYDLVLNSDAISKMEITLSPTISAENRQAVYDIVNDSAFCNSISILDSSIPPNELR